MNQFSQDQADAQVAALRHARKGVLPEELSSQGRLELLGDVVAVHIRAWHPSLPPGFEPYSRRVKRAQVDYGDQLTPRHKVMSLGEIELHKFLMVSTERTLFLERWGQRPAGEPSSRTVILPGEEDFLRIFANPGVLWAALDTIAKVTKKRLKQTTTAAHRVESRLALIGI